MDAQFWKLENQKLKKKKKQTGLYFVFVYYFFLHFDKYQQSERRKTETIMIPMLK